MVQLKTGWVIVGSLPSATGRLATAGAGCLLVLSPTGQLASTISGPYLDGPWDATVSDNGRAATVFVTSTLVGLTSHSSAAAQVNQGDVVRITLSESRSAAPKVTGETTIASGFGERPDAAAFVRGPTGLALGSSGTLYVADNLGNRIVSIPDALSRTTSAGTGRTLSRGGQLANPLGMVLAPDGDLLVANATNGKIVEITPAGRQVGEYYADDSIGQEPPGNGDLFDLAINQAGTGVLFVNDGTNALEVLH
jgi:sugar lactone lactonase YvrE